jgi:hypothetical protein
MFSGERLDRMPMVWVIESGKVQRALPLHLEVRNHSPSGFEWGYMGSGPAQLALAMCVELVGRERAERVYQLVKDRLVAPIQADKWWLSGRKVLDEIESIEREQGR